MSRAHNFYQSVKKLRERYFEVLDGKESLIKLLNEAEIPEHVYNSNAIENSTLTLEETEKILLKLDLSRYVSDREIFEAKNLALVMGYVESKAKTTDLTKELMLLLHKMLLGNIREDIAGRFRKSDEWVRVGKYIAANPVEIDSLLTAMISTLKANPEENVIKRIARLHLTFEHIHPFCDGNGRIGRVLNNFILLKEEYVPINIAFSNREEYYEAFRNFDATGETAGMEQIIGRALSSSYHKRLAYMENLKIIPLSLYAKNNSLALANIINKATRQTIPAFRENGVWKIGV